MATLCLSSCLGNFVARPGARRDVPLNGCPQRVHHPALHHARGQWRVLDILKDEAVAHHLRQDAMRRLRCHQSLDDGVVHADLLFRGDLRLFNYRRFFWRQWSRCGCPRKANTPTTSAAIKSFASHIDVQAVISFKAAVHVGVKVSSVAATAFKVATASSEIATASFEIATASSKIAATSFKIAASSAKITMTSLTSFAPPIIFLTSAKTTVRASKRVAMSVSGIEPAAPTSSSAATYKILSHRVAGGGTVIDGLLAIGIPIVINRIIVVDSISIIVTTGTVKFVGSLMVVTSVIAVDSLGVITSVIAVNSLGDGAVTTVIAVDSLGDSAVAIIVDVDRLVAVITAVLIASVSIGIVAGEVLCIATVVS